MTGDKSTSMQNDFFNRARKDGGPLTIYLTNGKKLTGRIKSFDKFTILVDCNRVEQMIFKHAISTVSLGRSQGGGGGGGGHRGGRPNTPSPAEDARPKPARPPAASDDAAPPAAPSDDGAETS